VLNSCLYLYILQRFLSEVFGHSFSALASSGRCAIGCTVSDDQSRLNGDIESIVSYYYAVSIITLQKVENHDEGDAVPAVASDVLGPLRQKVSQNRPAR
jgi:hypothetical protein